MVNNPEAMFFFSSILLVTCLVTGVAAGKPPRICLPYIKRLFLIVLRIYVYTSVSDSLNEDPTLYISLGLMHHIQHVDSI